MTKNKTGLTKITENEYVIIDNNQSKNFYGQKNFRNKFQK